MRSTDKTHASTTKNAPGTGKNTLPGSNRAEKNGSGQTAIGIAASGVVGFHILAKSLVPISRFEIGMRSGIANDLEQGIWQMVDSDEKQLQCIRDLYKIVKSQPKYKETKEPAWKHDTSPTEIIVWLLRKLGPLASGKQWTVDTYQSRGKTRYRFVVYQHYNSQMLEQQEAHLCLDFLPWLKNRDEPLHDLIIDIIALVSRDNKVPLWDEDGDFSEFIDFRKTAFISENLQRQSAIYSTGDAAQYLQLLKKRRKIVSAWEIEQRVATYNITSDRKRRVCLWLSDGLKLAATKECIKDYFYPNYVTGTPVTPFRLYKFIWSFHRQDTVSMRAYKKISADEKKYGTFYPVDFSIAKPGDVVKPLEHAEFPIRLFKFLEYGLQIFTRQHGKYFYKNYYGNQTPSENLLMQTIELDEITNPSINQIGIMV